MSDPFNDYSQTNTTDYQPTTLNCSVLVLSLIATLGSWFGGVIIFFLEKQNVYVRAVSLQSLIVNGITFLIMLFFLCLYFIHTFFVVMFWIVFVVYFIVIIALAILAAMKASTGVFIGIPFLDKIILDIANR